MTAAPRRRRRLTNRNEDPPVTQIALPETFPGAAPLYGEDPTTEIRATGRSSFVRWLEPASLVPTYFGVLVIGVGFALIGIAWAQIAALTNVALQMPYLVSAGITGLALVMVGLIIVNVAAKRQDGAERARQLQTLTDAVQALHQEISRLDGDGEQ